ncbi:hypothetical protein ACS0TY_025825 [Phlomoides rotata]
MVSYNIRGLGSNAKCREVRDLIQNLGLDFCCIQESKKELVDDILCKNLWGSNNVGWAFKESTGRAGGIMSLWNSYLFSMISSWNMDGVVVVNGMWGTKRTGCCMVNVYAPCLSSEWIDPWDRLQSVVIQNQSCCICIARDFNTIRRPSERAGRSEISSQHDMNAFDEFIRNSGLIDLPLHGRSFTWYRPDGTCKNRLDRILINNLWMMIRSSH